MLPIQDALPSRRRPRAILALIAAFGAAWFSQLLLAPANLGALIVAVGLSPETASPSRLFLSLFLTPGLAPTVANLGALWIFGDNVEDRLGPWRLLVLFGVGAIGAAIVVVELAPTPRTLVIGAAGAVGAIVGAHLSLFPRMRILVLAPFGRDLDAAEVPSLVIASAWLLLQGFRWFTAPVEAPPAVVTFLGPLVGLAVGGALAHGLKRRARMQADWWSPRR